LCHDRGRPRLSSAKHARIVEVIDDHLVVDIKRNDGDGDGGYYTVVGVGVGAGH